LNCNLPSWHKLCVAFVEQSELKAEEVPELLLEYGGLAFFRQTPHAGLHATESRDGPWPKIVYRFKPVGWEGNALGGEFATLNWPLSRV
jgi:hypothetical protein